MHYTASIKGRSFQFKNLKDLLAKATPKRSADDMAGISAASEVERAVAQQLLAEAPLSQFIEEPLIPPEIDEVSKLILTQHDRQSFNQFAAKTVGELRDWLLSDNSDLSAISYALTPEMVAAVSKIMRNQDLIAVSKRCRVVTRFRNTLGLPGHLSSRLTNPITQPMTCVELPLVFWMACYTEVAMQLSALIRLRIIWIMFMLC